MAEMKKYLGTVGLEALIDQIKVQDAATLQSGKDYSDSLAKNYDSNGAAATAKAEAIADADAKFATVNENIAKKADQTALEAEVTRATNKEAELLALIEATDAIADKNAEDIAAINHEETGILALAKADATSKANVVQAEVDALEEYVGVIPEGATATDIVGYVTEKTSGIASEGAMTELTNRVGIVEGKVSTIEGDYLKAADKTELQGKIDDVQGEVDALEETHATDKKALEDAIALKADQTALDDVSAIANAAVKQSDYDTKVTALEAEDARIAGLVSAEAERAAGAEAGLDERLVEVEAFFKLAEGEQLDTALDTLKEIQVYLDGEGAAADQMVLDIAANKKAIEDHVATDHDFAAADTALKNELNSEIANKADSATVEAIDGRMTTAEGKITTLEGKMTTVEGAVATKAEQSTLTQEIADRKAADQGLSDRLDAVEAQLGDGENSVSDLIATAKQEAIDAAAADATSKDTALETALKKYADDEDAKIESRVSELETVSATHALASDVTALAGRVTTAEGEIDTLQSEMDTVEAQAAANKAAHEANATEIAKKAAQTDLDAAVARIGANETAIGTINTTLEDKAEADDLDALAERVGTNETNIANLQSSVSSFVEFTAAEIDAYFA